MSSAHVPRLRPSFPRAGLARSLGGKLAELVTVFVGVYAAFLLNGYQIHRQERQRREQILAWLDQTYSEWYRATADEQQNVRKDGSEFEQQVAAGKMPALHAFNWTSDYNSADVTGLLQSGGFDLLEVNTIRSLKEVDGTLRRMVGLVHHDQQLSDALILPNLDKSPAMFYDPETKRLRGPYVWYSDFFKSTLEMFADLRPEIKKLLDQVHAERQRNR